MKKMLYFLGFLCLLPALAHSQAGLKMLDYPVLVVGGVQYHINEAFFYNKGRGSYWQYNYTAQPNQGKARASYDLEVRVYEGPAIRTCMDSVNKKDIYGYLEFLSDDGRESATTLYRDDEYIVGKYCIYSGAHVASDQTLMLFMGKHARKSKTNRGHLNNLSALMQLMSNATIPPASNFPKQAFK